MMVPPPPEEPQGHHYHHHKVVLVRQYHSSKVPGAGLTETAACQQQGHPAQARSVEPDNPIPVPDRSRLVRAASDTVHVPGVVSSCSS